MTQREEFEYLDIYVLQQKNFFNIKFFFEKNVEDRIFFRTLNKSWHILQLLDGQWGNRDELLDVLSTFVLGITTPESITALQKKRKHLEEKFKEKCFSIHIARRERKCEEKLLQTKIKAAHSAVYLRKQLS